MWPVFLQFLRSNLPYIALPFAAVVGFIGFSLESKLRSPERLSSSYATPVKTFDEVRLERRLEAMIAEEVPNNWQDVLTSPKLKYKRDPMFDKNKALFRTWSQRVIDSTFAVSFLNVLSRFNIRQIKYLVDKAKDVLHPRIVYPLVYSHKRFKPELRWGFIVFGLVNGFIGLLKFST